MRLCMADDEPEEVSQYMCAGRGACLGDDEAEVLAWSRTLDMDSEPPRSWWEDITWASQIHAPTAESRGQTTTVWPRYLSDEN